MIWLILGLIVCIIIVIRTCLDDWWHIVDKILLSILTVLLSVIGTGAILVLASGIVSPTASMEYNKTEDTQIIALKDNQNISGTMYLMGGYVGEDLYYYYAKETEYGYTTNKIKADNCYIKYTNEKPHIETYEADFEHKAMYWLGFPMVSNRYVIYCPENTITNEYSIDLE